MSESRSPSHDETLILPDIAVMGGPNPFPDDFPDREWMWEYRQKKAKKCLDAWEEQARKARHPAEEAKERNLLKAKAEAWRLAEGPDNDDPNDYDEADVDDPKNPLFWGKYRSEAGLYEAENYPDLNYPDFNSDNDFSAHKWGDDFDDRLNSGWEPWNDPDEQDDDLSCDDWRAESIKNQLTEEQQQLWDKTSGELTNRPLSPADSL